MPAVTTSASPPCRPCAGVRTTDPLQLLGQLDKAPRLDGEARLYLAWEVELARDHAAAAVADTIAASGAVPWMVLVFRTPSPLDGHLSELEAELLATSSLASAAGPRSHFQIVWRPRNSANEPPSPAEHAFLLKRAAVAVTGASSQSIVVSPPLSPEVEALRDLYSQEVAAYLDGIALQPATREKLAQAVEALTEMDPGKPLVLDSLPYPEPPERALAETAREAVAGFALLMFDLSSSPTANITPLKLLAREFQGDLSFDPYSTPTGEGLKAWSFVRGEDLSLRVIISHDDDAQEAVAEFSDAQLRRPTRIDPESGEALGMYADSRSPAGLELRWAPAAAVTLLRLERLSATEIAGVMGLEERLTVVSERELPVEEILRRLQASEDAQQRRLHWYSALNTTHLRFQLGTEGVEATFEGELFFRQGESYDWAWQRFFINGLRWKGQRLPEIPLIQPERAAKMPLEIHLTRDYRYRLRGTDLVDGRDCWVVDFQPGDAEPGKSLFRGTVWIDRQLFVRVRSRAIQLDLQGDVISNEETTFFSPVDKQGQPAEWSADSLYLPLRVSSQQIWSIFNSATVVEKETLLAQILINDPQFDTRRRELLASDVTMVRDTEAGLRYLVVDKDTGQRVVKEGFDTNRLFFAAGVFHDDALDHPLPLGGVDYFSLDFKDTGAQVNVFFAGVLLNANVARPDLLGSRFDAGADLFVLGVPFSDTLYRDGREVAPEEVEQRQSSLALTLGTQIGSFTKLTLGYRLGHVEFGRSDATAEEFLLPSDHFNHTLSLALSYSRLGYRLRLEGAHSRRSQWEPWGLPDLAEFDPAAETYQRWGASVAKTFHMRGFRKLGLELQYVDGDHLDRFSKYEFGFFSDIRVHGYQSEKVRAERAGAIHGSYGFELGELFRLQLIGDGAWATDRQTGLDQEFLAGVGVAGTLIGPWQTLIRLDVGTAVAGPDDGFTVFLALLKLYR